MKVGRDFDYEADDDPITDPLHSYEVNVYNQVLDTVIESISSRFEKHGQLCTDFACLDPNNFMPDVTLPKNALIGVFDKICNYCPGIMYEDFRNEYIDFISKWKEIKRSIDCIYTELQDYDENIDECSNDVELLILCSHNPNTNANYCVVCCFDVLVKYNLYTNAYPSLFVAYKLMLTLSMTQVGCEKSFSKLKYIKNYLRNTLGQDILESFMLMNVEKDLLSTIGSNDVINKLAARNSTFKNLLSF